MNSRRLRTLFDEARARYDSSITIFEIFKLSIEKEGKEVADCALIIQNEFEVVSVDGEIAKEGGRLGARLRIPMADSLIMATAKKASRTVCHG